MISLGENSKCLALAVLVVSGHPRARLEAVMSTSAEALPWPPRDVGEGIQVTAKTIRDAEKLLRDIRHHALIDLPLGTVSAVMSRAMATQTETLLPLIDPVDIVDMSIECVEVFLFQKNTFLENSCQKVTKFLLPQEVALPGAYCTVTCTARFCSLH